MKKWGCFPITYWFASHQLFKKRMCLMGAECKEWLSSRQSRVTILQRGTRQKEKNSIWSVFFPPHQRNPLSARKKNLFGGEKVILSVIISLPQVSCPWRDGMAKQEPRDSEVNSPFPSVLPEGGACQRKVHLLYWSAAILLFLTCAQVALSLITSFNTVFFESQFASSVLCSILGKLSLNLLQLGCCFF